MYKIIMDDAYIYHPWSRDRCITEGILTQEKNRNGTCNFTLPAVHPLTAQIKPRKSIVEVRFFQKNKEDEMVYRGVVMSSTSDTLETEVTTEGDLVFLQDSVIRPFSLAEGPGKATPEDYFRWLLEQHNRQVDDFKQFAVGKVTVQGDAKAYTQDNYQSSREAIEELISECGGIIRSRTEENSHYIDYLEEEDNGSQSIRQNENVIDITRSVKTDEIATRIIPLGTSTSNNGRPLTIASVNGGVDYLQDDAAVQEFGIITKTVDFSEIQDPKQLLKAGRETLQKQKGATVVTELDAVDLADAGYDVERLREGMNVPCIAAIYGIDQNLQIEKKVTNLLDPSKTRVTLGGTMLTYTQAQLKNNVFSKNGIKLDTISNQQIDEICS